MNKAAFVLEATSLPLEELRSFDGKIFASEEAAKVLEDAGIRAQVLRTGISQIFRFGHKEIHLFGMELCNADGSGERVAVDNKIFFSTPEQVKVANNFLRTFGDLTDQGAVIYIHGNGLFQHMAKEFITDAAIRPLTAVYDLLGCPPTYEIFSFLAEAERYRVSNRFTHIDLIFSPGPMHGFRDDGLPPSITERESMLHRICVAGARLLPSVRNVHILKKGATLEGDFFPPDWTNESPRFAYGPRFQKNAFQCLHATEAARREISRRFPHKYATVTLREAEYWPARNSNREAWRYACSELGMSGLKPIVVPDTHGTGFEGFECFSPAAWDIDLRMALYELAELNLGVMNGPMVLPMFSAKKPAYIVFQKPDEECHGTQKAFLEEQGIHEGDNYTDNGATLWQDDTRENIGEALRLWFAQAIAA